MVKKYIIKFIHESDKILSEDKSKVISEIKAVNTIPEMVNIYNKHLNTNVKCFNKINEYIDYIFDNA